MSINFSSPERIVQFRNRTYIIVAIQLLMAAAFLFRAGSFLPDKANIFYQSYFADLVMPFSFYFLLSLYERSMPFLRNWIMKGSIIFLGMTITEIFQYFGIYMFGVTFDPLDILAFAIGTIAAVVADQFIFPRVFSFWRIKN